MELDEKQMRGNLESIMQRLGPVVKTSYDIGKRLGKEAYNGVEAKKIKVLKPDETTWVVTNGTGVSYTSEIYIEYAPSETCFKAINDAIEKELGNTLAEIVKLIEQQRLKSAWEQLTDVEYGLHSLMISTCLLGGLGTEIDEKQVEESISDLLDYPRNFTNVLYMRGIECEAEELSLDTEIRIRKIKGSDFEEKIADDIMLGPPKLITLQPSMAIEVTKKLRRSHAMTEMGTRVNELDITLRFFSSGSVIMIGTRGAGLGRMGTLNRSFGNLQYKITDQNLPRLREFWTVMQSYYSVFSDKKRNVSNYAYNKYRNICIESSPVDMIASAVTCFETLIVIEETSDSHKVRQRVSKLLSYIRYDPLVVMNDLKEAYRIRNSFFHGRIPSENINQSAEKTKEKITEYLRLTVLIFMDIEDEKRESFVKMIDNSLLREKEGLEVQKLILDNPAIRVLNK